MKLAVLSGKGGAGKTLVSVNLAVTAKNAVYVDCDVEEPNGRLFLKPEGVVEESVGRTLPQFDAEKCTGCRQCVDFCRFNALIYIKKKPMLFAEVCHGCGGCSMVCPAGAIEETRHPVGHLEVGCRGKLTAVTGVLNLGEASGIPVIRSALKRAEALGDTVIIDAPPGSACSVMESIEDADGCILVAEPTAFGFHNFKMVYELTRLLKKPCGVVINKEDAPYAPLEDFCRAEHLPILAKLPYDREIAALAASGEIACEKSEKAKALFDGLYEKIRGEMP